MVELTKKQLDKLGVILQPFIDELELEIQGSGLDIEAVRMSRTYRDPKNVDWNINWETKE